MLSCDLSSCTVPPGLEVLLAKQLDPLVVKDKRQSRLLLPCTSTKSCTLLLLLAMVASYVVAAVSRCLVVGLKSWPTNKHDTKTRPHVALRFSRFLHSHTYVVTDMRIFSSSAKFLENSYVSNLRLEPNNTCLALAKLYSAMPLLPPRVALHQRR